MRRCVALVLVWLLLGGCVAAVERTVGVPWLAEDASPEAQLRALAERLLREVATAEEAQQLIGVPPGTWSAAWRPEGRVERYGWRVAVVERWRASAGVYGQETIRTRGYQLTVQLVNGRLAGVETEVVDLTEREREWATHQAVAVGAAAAGSLIMLGIR